MILGTVVASVAEADTTAENPRARLCGHQPAPLVRGSSATTHCHAAPAQPTREHQGDDRRCVLTSAALPALARLDKDFHIREGEGAALPLANMRVVPIKPRRGGNL